MIKEATFTYSSLRKEKKNKKKIEDQGKKQIKWTEEDEKQLVKFNTFSEKVKVYHLISKKKYSLILLQKEQEKLKNCIIVLIFKI